MPYSNSRTIELPHLIAGLLWATSTGLFALAIALIYLSAWHGAAVSYGAALIIAGVACCASVRVMLCGHYRAMQTAFNLGRETGRAEAGAVPLQRVH